MVTRQGFSILGADVFCSIPTVDRGQGKEWMQKNCHLWAAAEIALGSDGYLEQKKSLVRGAPRGDLTAFQHGKRRLGSSACLKLK